MWFNSAVIQQFFHLQMFRLQMSHFEETVISFEDSEMVADIIVCFAII